MVLWEGVFSLSRDLTFQNKGSTLTLEPVKLCKPTSSSYSIADYVITSEKSVIKGLISKKPVTLSFAVEGELFRFYSEGIYETIC